MATVFDYLQWRGDLDFAVSPFNEVDNIILCLISYINFNDVVPSFLQDTGIRFSDAAKIIKSKIKKDKFYLEKTSIFKKEEVLFIDALAKSERYKNIRLYAYVNNVDEETQTQFSAITVILPCDTSYICFRGTDSTLIGWKEDCNMAFSEVVPAQLEAVKYVENVIPNLRARVSLCGHSKGGNLAVFAASFCNPKTRACIAKVYSNDAPGFSNYVINSEGYKKIRKKIHAYIPDSSVIGLLFEHDEEFTLVKSEENGILSHSPYTWKVMRDTFVHARNFSSHGRFLQDSMVSWIHDMDNEQREQFTEGLYTVLSSTNAKSIYELTENSLKNTLLILHTFNRADKNTKDIITKTIGQLFGYVTKSIPNLLPQFTSSNDIQASENTGQINEL